LAFSYAPIAYLAGGI